MDWIQLGTLFISGATLLKVVHDSKNKQKQLEIDRRIEVMVEDQREKQRKLFEHVTALLNIEERFIYSKLSEEELPSILINSLSHKVGVWININRRNKIAEELRDNCTELATWLASTAEARMIKKDDNYLDAAHRNVMKIWFFINKYIEEEERLIEEMMKR